MRKKREKRITLCMLIVLTCAIFIPITAQAVEVSTETRKDVKLNDECDGIGDCISNLNDKIFVEETYSITYDKEYAIRVGDSLDYKAMGLSLQLMITSNEDGKKEEKIINQKYPENIRDITPKQGTVITEKILKDGKLSVKVSWAIPQIRYIASDYYKEESTYQTSFTLDVLPVDTGEINDNGNQTPIKDPETTKKPDTKTEATATPSPSPAAESEEQSIPPTAIVTLSDATQNSMMLKVECSEYCTVNVCLMPAGTITPQQKQFFDLEPLQERKLTSVKEEQNFSFEGLTENTDYVVLLVPVNLDGVWSEQVYRVDVKTKSNPTPPPVEETDPPVEIPEETDPPVEFPEETDPPVEFPEETDSPIEFPEETDPPVEFPEETDPPIEFPEETDPPEEV